MQPQTALLGQRRDRGHLIGAIGAAIFARLGDRNRMRLNLMDIVADRIDRGADGLRRKLRALPRHQQQLGAVEVEAGRAAFVHLDMRFLVAHHRAVRLDHGRQREAVGGGAGRHPQCSAVAPEQIGEPRIELARQAIAIIGRIRSVGGMHRLPHERVDGGGVVGEKLHRNAHRAAGVACKTAKGSPRNGRPRCDDRTTRQW